MIYSVEKIGDKEPCKYTILYNYGAYKREFIGESNLPKTVKSFIENSSYATSALNGQPWVTFYK